MADTQPDSQATAAGWALKPPGSLARRLLAILLLVSILPTLGVGTAIYVTSRQQRLAQVEEQFNAVLDLKESQIERWVSGRQRDLRLFANEPMLLTAARDVLTAVAQGAQAAPASEQLRARFEAIQDHNDQFLNLMLLDGASGIVLVATQESYEGRAYRQQRFFNAGLTGPYVQPPQFDVSLELDAPTMIVAQPIQSQAGQTLGVLAGKVNLAALDQIIEEGGLGRTGTTTMIDKSGLLIAGGPEAKEYAYQHSVRTEGTDRALSGRSGFDTYLNLDDRPVVGAYRWLAVLESGLLVEQEVQEVVAPLNTLLVSILVAMLVISAFMTVASIALARWITGPIVRLTDTARAMADGDLSQAVSVERGDEVGALALAFGSMAHQLREFISRLEQRVSERTAELTAANQELAREISERLRAEEALRSLKELNEEIVQNMAEGIVVQDEEGRFVFVNPAAAAMLGYTVDEMLALPWTAVVPPDQQPIVEAADVRRTQGKADRYELQALRRDGQRLPILISGSPRYEGRRFTGTLAVFTDISQRVQAEQSLRESEERFRAIVEGTQAMLMNVDRRGIFTYLNEGAARMVGLEPEELIGKLYLRFVHPDDRAWVSHVYLDEVTARQPGATFAEFRILTASGEVRWIRVASNAILKQGRIAGQTAVALDVTERVLAEQARERLLASEREQRLLAETLQGVTLALTSQTEHTAVLDEILVQAQRLVPCNATSIALLSGDTLTIARAVGDRPFQNADFMGLEQPLSDYPLDAGVLASGQPYAIADTRREPLWTRLKETRWIRAHLSVPIYLHDQPLGLLRLESRAPGAFTVEDANKLRPLAAAAAIAIENARLVAELEAKVAERTAAIRAEQEKGEAILRSVRSAIALAGLDGRLVYINSAFSTLTGYTSQEVLGRTGTFLFAERLPDQQWQSLSTAVQEGRVWQGDVVMRRKNGRIFDAALTIAPVRDAGGELVGYVSSHDDISQQKELERARRRFITNISHEMRTPVTNMQLYANILRTGVKPEKTAHYLEVLDEQAKRLGHLVEDIIELTSLESGQAVRSWEPIPIPTMLHEAVTRFQERATAAGLRLEVRPLPPNLPAVRGDRVRLTQALAEVVENAVVFTLSAGRESASQPTQEPPPEIGRVTIKVGGFQQGERRWLMLSVHDTGPGIPPDELAEVFDPFFRGRIADPGHIAGTGMGLAIAQEILRAHGGRITVTSTVGQGSTFTLWLPGFQA